MLDLFTLAYIKAALLSSTDDDGELLDTNYGIHDLAPATLKAMIADCKRFQEENATDIATLLDGHNCQYCCNDRRRYAGRFFWLTRNLYDTDWEEGKRLITASRAYGEVNLCVVDGRIHIRSTHGHPRHHS